MPYLPDVQVNIQQKAKQHQLEPEIKHSNGSPPNTYTAKTNIITTTKAK